MRHYVYMLRCRDNSLYTGWTNDPVRRLRAHNEGKGAKYTRSRGPVSLADLEVLPTKEAALQREYAIKQLTRQEKEDLVNASAPPRPGRIYYLMGKSAAGKDKLHTALLAREDLALEPLVIYTTRPIRQGEQDGVEYHFTDIQNLEILRKTGKVVEERTYRTVYGPWTYFTVDDDRLDLTRNSYLGIGTPESFRKVRKYYGTDMVLPIYVETDDGIRLSRALKRERKQPVPRYEEMCRRFLADQKDFAPKKLKEAGIDRIFENNDTLEECEERIAAYIRETK